uniref:C-type lectin domain-containing protein n=1 Tax=Arion vulgaris TaxID=1028688 RepID=A0A0B7B6E0_9EUPU
MMRFVLLLAMTVTCAFGDCLEGWRELNEHCYSFHKEAVTWIVAFSYCESIRARLVEIHSEEVEKWLVTQLDELGFEKTFAGMSRRIHAPNWLWETSGICPTYTNWIDGEPNGDASEECLEINVDASKGWNDVSCVENKPFICEKSAKGINLLEYLNLRP